MLAVLAFFLGFSPAQAIPEIYTLTISPYRTQEANSPGVTLTLNVTSASVTQAYSFAWSVVDPSGNGKSAVSSQGAGQSSFVLSAVYPRDFGGGASMGFVGLYSVSVAQTVPVPKPVGSGQFAAGLTDRASYVRTNPVSVKATGYSSNENVSTRLNLGGTPAAGAPKWVLADGGGNVAFGWQTGSSTLTGNYTVALAGSTTATKNPPDTQTFSLTAATLTVVVNVPNNSLGLGDRLTIYAPITYPDGTSLNQGTVTALLSSAGRSIGGSISLKYDGTGARWVGNYTVGGNDPSGTWLVQVSASDPYGNTGQNSASLSASVIPANNPASSSSFWFISLLGALAASAVLVVFLLKKKKVLRRELQVDLKAVGLEADRVMGQDFFKSIKEQLGKKKEPADRTDNG